MSGQVATHSFVAAHPSGGVLSVSIGLLNLFPIPLLDGGHLLFYSIEALRGRPLSERAQEVGFRIGLAIVLMLMIFATFNDIVHLATSWVAKMRRTRGGEIGHGNCCAKGGDVAKMRAELIS